MDMEELISGLRKLQLSLVLLLVSQINLALMEQSEALMGYDLRLQLMLLSAALILLSYALALRGLTDACNTLSGVFCVIRRLVKYLLPATLIFTIIGISYTYEDLQSLTLGIDAFLERPILLLPTILFTLLLVIIAYSLLKLGSSVGSSLMKVGSVLLIPSPLVVVAGYPTYGSLVAIVGSLISLISLTKLIKAEVEVVEEEQVELPEEYEEEPEEVPQRPRRTLEERQLPSMRERLEIERLERVSAKPKERRAKLLGPNGLTIELELGVRMFGRRNFLGYVPEEDLDYISRRHFEIKGTKEGFFIRDLGSLNGTWVNGNKLERGEYVKLTNGSVIDVAEVIRLRFSLESEDLGVPEI
ncbi:MAG: FHA domain-containing protein [Candidatus Korarchaeum sp.]|nr:FHA domain-containing protein [Candidatus Korarchaeum sp.]MDW8034827.1 FHA domain-containing protein [Candidatus Korarchaeum sp.]